MTWPSSPALLPTNTLVKAGLERDVKAGFSSCTVELVMNAELRARTGSGSTWMVKLCCAVGTAKAVFCCARLNAFSSFLAAPKANEEPAKPAYIYPRREIKQKEKGFSKRETKRTWSLKFWKFCNEIDSVSLTCCFAARNGWILSPALFVIVPKAARFCPCCVALACPSSILAFFKALLSALSWKLFVMRNANDILTRN